MRPRSNWHVCIAVKVHVDLPLRYQSSVYYGRQLNYVSSTPILQPLTPLLMHVAPLTMQTLCAYGMGQKIVLGSCKFHINFLICRKVSCQDFMPYIQESFTTPIMHAVVRCCKNICKKSEV